VSAGFSGNPHSMFGTQEEDDHHFDEYKSFSPATCNIVKIFIEKIVKKFRTSSP
jgi:hypothetical protein